jgi:predicted KAP-like P-loop ATPase
MGNPLNDSGVRGGNVAQASLPSKADHKWNADRPGEHPEDDELGRAAFAQRIAKELRAWRQKDSLVVSLNGD